MTDHRVDSLLKLQPVPIMELDNLHLIKAKFIQIAFSTVSFYFLLLIIYLPFVWLHIIYIIEF